MPLNTLKALFAEMPWLAPAVAFVYGTIVGSFLNVCIYRIPYGRSIIRPGSTCACGKPIAWYDNIPVLSWFVLRGRARCCGRPYGIRYPMVEALTGGLFVAAWHSGQDWAASLCFMAFASILVCATFTDLDHRIIPDRFTVGGFLVGCILSAVVPSIHGRSGGFAISDNLLAVGDALLGTCVGTALLVWIMILGSIAFRKEAMGFGDVKFMGCIGAFCGWQGALFSVFGGALLGCAAVLAIKLAGMAGLGKFLKREKPAPIPVDESEGTTLYIEVASEGPEPVTPTLSIPADQPVWHPDNMSMEAQGETRTTLPDGRVRSVTRWRAQAREESDPSTVPFGPMLAAAALVYLFALSGPVDAWFRETLSVLLGGRP